MLSDTKFEAFYFGPVSRMIHMPYIARSTSVSPFYDEDEHSTSKLSTCKS